MLQFLSKGLSFLFSSDKIDASYLNTSGSAKASWEDEFRKGIRNHARQNRTISRDFLLHANNCPLSLSVLAASGSVLEFGCGSGEMLYEIKRKFPNVNDCLGIDISEIAVSFANKKYQSAGLEYRYLDALQNDGFSSLGKFSLVICSNTLEHFKNPYEVINKILDTGTKYCIFLVPYLQPCKDVYAAEGGMGHVYTFDDSTFSQYQVVAKFTFRTKGWSYSSNGEIPTQLAVLIKNVL